MSPTPQEIYQRLYNAVSVQHGVPLHCSLSPETNFVRDLDADSLDLVELVMAVEDEFEIDISDEVGERLHTMNDAFLHICSALLSAENSQQLEAVILEVGEVYVKVADLTESQMRWVLCKVTGLPLPMHATSVDWTLVGPLVSRFQVSMTPQLVHGNAESWTCKTHANPSNLQAVGEGTSRGEEQLFAAAAAVLDLLCGKTVRIPKALST